MKTEGKLWLMELLRCVEWLSWEYFVCNFDQIYNNLILMGAGAVCCPPAIQPPTPQHAKCKKILMVLTVGLIPIAILALVVGQAFQFFICLFLAFFLCMGWRLFNWCTILIFFLYSLQQILQSTLLIIGFIEYDQFFKGKHITESVYLVVQEIYFIFAILVSHYIYRVFKTHSNGDGLIFNNNPPPDAPQAQGEYRALVQENRGNRQDRPNQAANAFQGQGVMIG